MLEIPIMERDKVEYLDICKHCYLVWFDPNEFESLPKVEVPEPKAEEKLPIKAQEALVRLQLESEKHKEIKIGGISESDPPEYTSENILGVLGFPIEDNAAGITNRPVVTIIIALLMFLVTIFGMMDLRSAVENFGLIPAEFTRYFGFTFISSFFLHAGFLHLFGNLYFLIVFGDNVEDILGRKGYIILIVLAAFFGDILYICSDPQGLIPCVGASGAISGILAYYCLRFPNASLRLFYFLVFRFGWFRIPVKIFLVLWILLQVLEAFQQRAGLADFSAFAHLGGASIGIMFWWLEKRSFSKSTQVC
jgi:membrane associated rhomboid family serine protease